MIAVTVLSPDLKSKIDSRFGRAKHLLLVNPKTLRWEAVENAGHDASGGAGIRLAQLLSDRKVDAVISGRFGPKASDALERAGIAMHSCEASFTAEEAVSALNQGTLQTPAHTRSLKYVAGAK